MFHGIRAQASSFASRRKAPTVTVTSPEPISQIDAQEAVSLPMDYSAELISFICPLCYLYARSVNFFLTALCKNRFSQFKH